MRRARGHGPCVRGGGHPPGVDLRLLGVFWGAAAAFWFDHPALVPFRRSLGYRSGREFMLRFPLPDRGRRRRRDPREDALALAVFASYPLWLWLGWAHGRRARRA